jgi:hypothetical protein
MSHECPRNGCTRAVADDLLLCAPCWRPVPLTLRRVLNDAWDHGRGNGSDAHREAMLAIIRHVNGEPEPAPKLTPHQLWEQAGGGTPQYRREEYRRLLREHGHLIGPGDPGYDPDAPKTLECGWPGPQRPGWDPDGG